MALPISSLQRDLETCDVAGTITLTLFAACNSWRTQVDEVCYWQILLQKSPTRPAKGVVERWCGRLLPPAPVGAAAGDALILTPATRPGHYPTLTQHTRRPWAAVGP